MATQSKRTKQGVDKAPRRIDNENTNIYNNTRCET